MYTSRLISLPCKNADLMSVVFIVQLLMDEIARKILMVPFPTVGLSLGIINSSSNPLTTRRAFVCPSLFVITHLVDRVCWPQSLTSWYVLKCCSFCNSASFADVSLLLMLFCFSTELTFASSVINCHWTWSRFTLFFSLLISSCKLYQY